MVIMKEVRCPKCNGRNVIRKGRRKTKFGYRQFYYCKDCGEGFIGSRLLNKTYGPRVITNAISYYNLGNTLEESAKLTNRRFKVNISKSSVHQWLKEFREICTYHKLRSKVLKNYGKEITFSKTFEHNGLSYNFKCHKPKLEMLCNRPSLMEYIEGFERGCPKFFDAIENRCSQLRIDVKIKKHGGYYNNACKLASLALKSAKNNKERHALVENFMLINDSSTIACEVPVWLWEKNLDIGISGHIDLLQIRQGKIYVIDFKPEAERENENKVASQLYLYASALSFRTRIPLENLRCAWFDDKVYYEFNPIEAKVRFPESKWRSKSTPKSSKAPNFGNPKQRILEEKAANLVSKPSSESWKKSGGDWKGLRGKQVTDFGKFEVMKYE